MFYKETNFKETLIGKIPKDWNVMKLDNFVEIETGKRAKGGALDKGNVASIGGEHIGDEGNIQWDDMKFIPEDFYNFLKQGKVKLRDILLVKDGATTGKVAIVKNLEYEKVAVNEHVFIIRSRTDRLINEFLFYFLFSKFGQIQIKTRFHGLIGGIIRNDLETILLPIPSVQEQQKITEILLTLDEAIQKTNEIIAKTERLKKGLMQELLTKGIGHKEFKDTEIGRIPKEWEVVRLKDVLLLLRNGLTAKQNKEGNGYPVTRIETISEEKIDPSKLGYVSGLAEKDAEEYKLIEGDVLFSHINSLEHIGKTAIYEGVPKVLLHGMNLLLLRPDKNKIHPKFLLQLLRLFRVRKIFWAMSKKAVNQASINQTELGSLRIFLPSIGEQQKIAEILSTNDEKLRLERNEKTKLERIKQGLMDLLLTGKIRVKVS
jgi:type I restriction enzyme S subunit